MSTIAESDTKTVTDTAPYTVIREGNLVTLTIFLEITENLVRNIRKDVQAFAEGGASNFIVDISRLEMVASIAVGLLVGIRAKTVETKGRIVVVNKSPTIQKMFEMIRLDAIIPIVATLPEAMAIIQQK